MNGIRPSAARPEERRRPAGRSLVLAAVTFAMVLDLAGVVILLPSMQSELGANVGEATWVVAVFVLAAAATLPLGSRLSAAFGSRRMLLIGLSLFALASLIAALAPTTALLIAARAVQGFGVAWVEPAVRFQLRAAGGGSIGRPDEQLQDLAALLAAALGPVLPAVLATVLSWRAQFSLEAVLAIAITAAASRVVVASPPRRESRHRLAADFLLTGLGLIGSAGLFVAVIEGPEIGWGSAPLVGTGVGALVLLAILATIASRRRDPLLPVRLLRRRRIAAGNIVRALTEFTSLGVFFGLSGHLQDDLGYSPLIAGLLLMPIILGGLLTAPIAEKYGHRVDVRWFLVPGLLGTAAGVFWLAHAAPEAPWWFFLAPLAVAGAGIGAVESPTELVIRTGAPGHGADAHWRLARVFYLGGIGAGVAVVSAVWRSAGVHTAEGLNSALIVCVIAAAAAVVVATVLPAGKVRPPLS